VSRTKQLGFAAAVVAALAVTGAGAATAVAGSTGPPCTPKITKIGGKPAVIACGPATATVSIGGKTYSFKSGFCESSTANKEALHLTLGTVVETTKPGSAPYFDITVSTPHLAAVNADYGGKAIVLDGLVSVKGKIPSNGTFAGTTVGAGATAKFTGSWNCNGAVYNEP
jgi:hypothetical protein